MLHNTATQNTLQHTATHLLQIIAFHAAQHCNAKHTATHCNAHCKTPAANHRVPCCTTLQHAATRYNTLQHSAMQTATNLLRIIAFHAAQQCNTLQHAATLCNTNCNKPAANHRGPCVQTKTYRPSPYMRVPV